MLVTDLFADILYDLADLSPSGADVFLCPARRFILSALVFEDRIVSHVTNRLLGFSLDRLYLALYLIAIHHRDLL